MSFDLPAQADTLHSANKGRVKVRGKRRPQTRAARRLAAQESSEAEDVIIDRGPVTQLSSSPVLPNGHQPLLQPRMASGETSSEKAMAVPWEGGPVLSAVDRSFFVKSLPQTGNEAHLFDSGDIFPKSTGSQSMEGASVKAGETPAHSSAGRKEKSLVFPDLSEASGVDDLFQSAKPRPTKKRNPFPSLKMRRTSLQIRKAKRISGNLTAIRTLCQKLKTSLRMIYLLRKQLRSLFQKKERRRELWNPTYLMIILISSLT